MRSDTHTDYQNATTTRRHCKTALSALFLLLLWQVTCPALAQDESAVGDETETEQTDVPKSGSADNDAAVQLETVTVTANKRVQNVREVADSISIVDEQRLLELHANSLTDFASYVPGLFVTSGGSPGQTTVSLRGIAPITSGAGVGMYIDNIPVGSSGLYQRQSSFVLDLLPYAVERVVVLRGPQGTLYGAGAIGGILKYVTVDPDTLRTFFQAGAGVSMVSESDELGWDARIGANVALIENELAVRVDYGRHEIPGYIDNSRTGEEDINDGTQESARVNLLWRPSSDVRLELVAMQQSIDSDNDAQVALDPQTLEPINGELTNQPYFNELFEKEINLYAGTLQWNLGWAEFTSVTGYSDTSTLDRVDATLVFGELPLVFGNPAGLSFFDLSLDFEKFTQEFRLVSKPGSFEWLAGLFYTDEDATNRQMARLFTQDREPISALDPLVELGIPSQYKETAFFGHASYHFTDRFELGTGVRFSSIDQEFAQIVQPGSPLLAAGTTPGSSSEDVFTWEVSSTYELAADSMLYAKVATGYQPGGPNVALPNVPPSVDSSTTTNYEIGLKSQFLDGRARFDVTVYRIDWQDIQVGAIASGVSFLTNAGEAVSQGLEFTSILLPTNQLMLTFTAAYTDAELTEDGPLVAGFRTGFDGNQLPYVPELSWSATADYNIPMQGRWNANLGAGIRWQGERETALTSTLPTAYDSPPLDSYYALDLHAGVTNGSWAFRAYARNVTDERAYLAIAPLTGAITGVTQVVTAVPIQPRTVGVAVDYTF